MQIKTKRFILYLPGWQKLKSGKTKSWPEFGTSEILRNFS